MEKTCGSSLPTAVTSTSNIVEVFFHTDNYDDSNSGWRLAWRAVTPGSVCPGPTPPTPGQPCSQLPGALECTYDEPDTCCCGRCERIFTCVFDNSTSDSGVWQLSLCPVEGCGSEGVVTSPSHPDNYPNNIDKKEHIIVDTGKILRLEFTIFAVYVGLYGSITTCPTDFVRITDGDGTTLMDKSCGYSDRNPSYSTYFQPPILTT